MGLVGSAMSKPKLTERFLQAEARAFADREDRHAEPSLYGVTDGKAVGTYLEQKFRAQVATTYEIDAGNSARGIDFPDVNVDIKVTSERQPQSSCPFQTARQKLFGLGYSLLVFVYDKKGRSTAAHSNPCDQARPLHRSASHG